MAMRLAACHYLPVDWVIYPISIIFGSVLPVQVLLALIHQYYSCSPYHGLFPAPYCPVFLLAVFYDSILSFLLLLPAI